jgi:2-C-methyl-D-erythritol 2,4-cyclodiphosphate synthase
MTAPAFRIGHGVDAHRFVPRRPLMLGGVRIPYDRGLMGHSDGDAVAHALADALLGAAGLGDMGSHFPSSDPQWRNTAGCDFLDTVATKLHEAGYAIVSGHVVALAEEPRLSPHLDAMRAALCTALHVDDDVIAVGCTTTDGMGFAGRGEGIAASATVIIAPL